MASPREGEERPKRETGPTASSGESPPPPPQPQHPPPYSPVMGYPGYPNPYVNYPDGPYNTQYGAYPPQAPSASYYGSDHRSSDGSAGFFRGIISGLIILVVVSLSIFITWLVLRPQIPIFSVTHFSVSGFNATRDDFTAQWTANLTVQNPNTKLKAYFNKIQGFIYHQNAVGEDQFMATGFFTPVYAETKKTVEIGERFTAGDNAGEEEPEIPAWVGEEMMKERQSSGTVSFSLRIAVWVKFKTEGWGERERVLKVLCEKLKVGFDGDSGNGAVSLLHPMTCLVYL